jgi:hypothetical protein
MLDTVAWAFPAGSFAGVGKRPAVLWGLSAVKQRNTVIQAPLGAMAATVVADRDSQPPVAFPPGCAAVRRVDWLGWKVVQVPRYRDCT